MFNSKSFDLKNDDISKQPENLYQPRRVRWLKYIIQPFAIGFVIILIIANVDFSSEQPQILNNALEMDLKISSKYFEWCQVNCSTHQINRCNKNFKNLFIGQKDVDNNADCSDYLSLRIEKYSFPNGILKNDFLPSICNTRSLVLYNCTLKYIREGVFDKHNFKNLLNLELINTSLRKVTIQTFRGLNNLQNFTLINSHKILTCNQFLTPLSQTLQSVTINLQYTNLFEYKPEDFFGLTAYKMLTFLDLSGNNLGDALETENFENLPALEYINLSNCRLRSIDFKLMNGTFSALRYLDLSGNILKELDDQFIRNSIQKGIGLNLVNNNWNCINASLEMLNALEINPCMVRNSRSILKPKTTTTTTTTMTTNFVRADSTVPTTEATLTTNAVSTTILNILHTTEPRTETTFTTQSTAKPTVVPPPAPPPPTTPTSPLDTTEPTTARPLTTEEETTSTKHQAPAKPTTKKIISPTPPPPPTTPVLETTITDDNTHYFCQIVCVDSSRITISNTTISYNAKISISDDSQNAVKIQISQLYSEYFHLIYFIDPTSDTSQIKMDDAFINLGHTTVNVKDLNCNTPYIFCLLFEENMTSPFNCRSHQTLPCLQIISWFEAHILLIISLSAVGILLSVLIGMFTMYGILWLRPYWLCGSKRLVRPARESHTMVLMPRHCENDYYGTLGSPIHESTIDDYVAYYRHLEQTKLYEGRSNKYSIPPRECAPSAPHSDVNSRNSNAYTYESFELYEELN